MPARRCQEESPGLGLMGSETRPVICTWMWLQRLLIAVTELISQPARGHPRSDPPEWEVCFRWSSRPPGHPQVCSRVLAGLTHPTPAFSCSVLPRATAPPSDLKGGVGGPGVGGGVAGKGRKTGLAAPPCAGAVLGALYRAGGTPVRSTENRCWCPHFQGAESRLGELRYLRSR